MKRYALVLPSVFVMIFMAAAPLCASVVSEQGVGEQRVLVIMAKFPDVQPSFSIKKMQNKYFDKLSGWTHSYINFEMSDSTDVEVEITSLTGPISTAVVRPAHKVTSSFLGTFRNVLFNPPKMTFDQGFLFFL